MPHADDTTGHMALGPGWSGDERAIHKTVRLPSFRAVIGLVDRLAELAEKTGHHPDLDIRYTTLVIHLTTHDAGRVTQRDLAMAEQIDAWLAADGVAGQ